jgi:hypothetical protein
MAATEAILITGVINAKQRRDIMTNDVPNALVQTPIPQDGEKIIMKIRGQLVDLLLEIVPEAYEPYIVYEDKKMVLHVRMLRALYGMLLASILIGYISTPLHEKPRLLLSQFFGMQSILILCSEKSSPQTPTLLNNKNSITGRSRACALRMVDFATFAWMAVDSDLDMSLDDPMDWEDFGTVGPMDIDSDSDDDMSLHDPMDWEDTNSTAPMDIDDPMDSIISSFGNHSVSDRRCPSSSSFIVDEHGWLVRRSPRLRYICGSIFLPLMDRRYL